MNLAANGMRMSEETAKCTVCRQPLGENGRCQHCDDDGHHTWTIQDWRPLLTLGLVIVLGFSFTSLVVNAFSEKQRALAAEYYQPVCVRWTRSNVRGGGGRL